MASNKAVQIPESISGEVRFRQYRGIIGRVVTLLAVVTSLFVMFYVIGGFDYLGVIMMPEAYRGLALAMILSLIFLMVPAYGSERRDKMPWHDIIFLIMGATGPVYYFLFFKSRIMMLGSAITTTELIMGIAGLTALFEACRRLVGWVLPSIGAFFFLHALFCDYFPGVLMGKGFSLIRVVGQLFMTTEGIFGPVFGVAVTVVILFVIFARALAITGGGKFFIDLALALVGHLRGGPAMAAVVSSALFGTLSGSPVSNVLGTGIFTIPLMKRIGYKPHFAGAVEAVASTGGIIMPPVMGAVIFLMVEFAETPYIQICAAALLPAILYYVALLEMVYFEAVKTGMQGLPRAELPSLRKVLSRGWPYFVPILVLVFLLAVMAYSPTKSCVYALLSLLIVSMIREETRLNLAKIVAILKGGALGFLDVAAICALMGIVLGSISLTGLGIALSGSFLQLAGGNIPFLLVLISIVCFVMGMGVSAIASYVIMVVLTIPALIQAGLLPIASHLFVIYMGMTTAITPPFALAAIVAAQLAGANMWRTAYTAVRLGIVAYLVPFIFINRPALLMIGSPSEIALAATTALVGVTALALGMVGYLLKPIGWPLRALLLAGGLLLMIPGWQSDIIGLVCLSIVVLVVFWQLVRSKAIEGGRKICTLENTQ